MEERKSCMKHELLSLIGLLQHACRVVRSGRSFLRRMINLSSVAREPHHHIRLNMGFRSDLEWWATFLPVWNGVGLMGPGSHGRPSLLVTSDASGSWGCGAFTNTGSWFQLPWSGAWKTVHITCKELLPIVLAGAVWGRAVQTGTMRCKSDNAAVVGIVNSGSSKDDLAMHLVRCLSFFTAHFQLVVAAEYIPGQVNVAADALSRDRLSQFRLQVPTGHGDSSRTPGHASVLPPRLDLAELERVVQGYFAKGLAPSTATTYKNGQDRYIKFYEAAAMTPLPIQESQLCSFVAFLAEEKLKHCTIKTYMLAVRHLQIRAGFPDPFGATIQMPRLGYVLRGVGGVISGDVSQSHRTFSTV